MAVEVAIAYFDNHSLVAIVTEITVIWCLFRLLCSTITDCSHQFANYQRPLSTSKMFSQLFLLVLLPLAITATPISAPPAGVTPAPGVMFDEIHVDCPNDAAQHAYNKCYDDSALENCGDQPGPDKKICDQLWQIWCGEGAGCHVTES
ncbi:hypothetical protein F4814DRAFT_444541 [Daldinia grandis]|nr:hypothetical protein F4814DRAFT_444541 [Daldinia grandis]